MATKSLTLFQTFLLATVFTILFVGGAVYVSYKNFAERVQERASAEATTTLER